MKAVPVFVVGGPSPRARYCENPTPCTPGPQLRFCGNPYATQIYRHPMDMMEGVFWSNPMEEILMNILAESWPRGAEHESHDRAYGRTARCPRGTGAPLVQNRKQEPISPKGDERNRKPDEKDADVKTTGTRLEKQREIVSDTKEDSNGDGVQMITLDSLLQHVFSNLFGQRAECSGEGSAPSAGCRGDGSAPNAKCPGEGSTLNAECCHPGKGSAPSDECCPNNGVACSSLSQCCSSVGNFENDASSRLATQPEISDHADEAMVNQNEELSSEDSDIIGDNHVDTVAKVNAVAIREAPTSSRATSVQESTDKQDVSLDLAVDKSDFDRDGMEHVDEEQLQEITDDERRVLNNDDNSTPFRVAVDLSPYTPEEIQVKLTDNKLLVDATHESVENGLTTENSLHKMITLPPTVDPDSLRCFLTDNGQITITAEFLKQKKQDKVLTIEM